MAEPLNLVDGQLVVNVTNQAGDTLATHSLDVLALRLACEEAEEHHRLAEDDQGRLKPTFAFLTDLAGRLAMFVPDCTPSMAYQLWVASAAQIEALKKNTSVTPSSPTGSESSPGP